MYDPSGKKGIDSAVSGAGSKQIKKSTENKHKIHMEDFLVRPKLEYLSVSDLQIPCSFPCLYNTILQKNLNNNKNNNMKELYKISTYSCISIYKNIYMYIYFICYFQSSNIVT